MNLNRPLSWRSEPCLIFSPLAWLKLQLFCHAGDTEIGGFALSAPDHFLYVEDFLTVRQRVTSFTVQFDDQAVADFYDDAIDRGWRLDQCSRIWCHTHPGHSAEPTSVDEDTFARVFGRCDWAIMFILSRTGQTYARLGFTAGPGGQMLLPVQVDWSAWPDTLSADPGTLESLFDEWASEFKNHVEVIREKPVGDKKEATPEKPTGEAAKPHDDHANSSEKPPDDHANPSELSDAELWNLEMEALYDHECNLTPHI